MKGRDNYAIFDLNRDGKLEPMESAMHERMMDSIKKIVDENIV